MARHGRAFPSAGLIRRTRRVAIPSAAVTGTATASITEADVVTGGKTIIITLTEVQWVAVADFNAQRQNIINGLDSAQSEALGWDLQVKALEVVGAVVRTSDNVVTVTLSASALYNITATETITVTVPASALLGAPGAVIGAPTFTVSAAGVGLAGPLVGGRLLWGGPLRGGVLVGAR